VWSSVELLSGVCLRSGPIAGDCTDRSADRSADADDLRLTERLGYHGVVLAAWGLLEWTFVLLLVGLTGAVGLAFLYMVGTLFVNPGRRKRSV
jgi:hypothetical protein